MGGGNRALWVKFKGKLRLEIHGTTISSDAGLLVYRELEEAFGLTAGLKEVIEETRIGKNIRHSLTAFLRQHLNSSLFDKVIRKCQNLSQIQAKIFCLQKRFTQSWKILKNFIFQMRNPGLKLS